VSLAFVEKVLRQHRTTGHSAPKPHAGGQKPRLGTAAQAVVQRLVAANPEATLEEWCTGVAAETGVRGRVPTMCRVLQHLGVPRKKRRSTPASQTPSASNRRGPATKKRSPRSPPQRFKCIDASGANLAMTRRYGRAPRGERVIGAVPQHDGAHVTMRASLGSHGLEAMMTVEGATDAEVFRVYVEQVLRPTLHPGDIVIMDNLGAHNAAGIREAEVVIMTSGVQHKPYGGAYCTHMVQEKPEDSGHKYPGKTAVFPGHSGVVATRGRPGDEANFPLGSSF
jgi:transposase